LSEVIIVFYVNVKENNLRQQRLGVKGYIEELCD